MVDTFEQKAGGPVRVDFKPHKAVEQIVAAKQEPSREVAYEITTVERALAFDKPGQHNELAKQPTDERSLHEGHTATGNMAIEESKRVIDLAAESRGLMVRDSATLGGRHSGEIVSVSSHHAMLKVGDMVAVRYERSNLDHDVREGEKLVIQYGKDKSQVYEKGHEPVHDRGRNMQMEHERTFGV